MSRITSFERDGLTFDSSDSGPLNGEPVVLLHGFPQTNTSWDKVAPLLHPHGYRTIAPNQRGYSPGARPKGRRPYRVTELVNDVLTLIDVIGQPVHLVGHDWGAAVSWALASQHPEQVRSHVAVSVPHTGAFLKAMPRGQALRSWYMYMFNLPFVAESLLTRPKTARRMLGLFGMPADAFARYEQEFLNDRERLKAALGWYRAIALEPMGKAFLKTPVPTTYVWSSGDAALSAAGARMTADFVTGDYTFEALEGSHWVPDEQPEALAGMIVNRAQNS